MSLHQAFRRQPVPQQAAQNLQAMVLPAPTRGLILNENWSYMKPGGAMVCDNWAPTRRGVKLRGGCQRYSDLHALDATVPPVPSPLRAPVISTFEYQSGNTQRMFAGQVTKLFDVTSPTPVLVKSGQTSGNYVAAQLANLSGEHMLVANETGDYLLHYDGIAWTTYNASQITTNPSITPPPSCATGHNLIYVWKYRSRYFFIEGGTMNAWYLPVNAISGQLNLIPLAGACTKGGRLMWGATWSLDAGDGIDEKCVFGTDQGELLIFTGTDPSNAANWRQEGRYAAGAPMGMNAHSAMGGDLLLMTVEGIVPISAVITKDAGQLDLNMLTVAIKPMWRDEVNLKRSWAWTMKRWDEYGGIFVTWPGGTPGNRYCAVINSATGAWCRFVGYDATCFARIRGDMFFGNQDGIVMQADRTGNDDGQPYVATLVGGWEMFQSPAQTVTRHQARASFTSSNADPFQPQLSSTTDYQINLPPPPSVGADVGLLEVWDQGLWDHARWDQATVAVTAPVRNTLWVSIGATGFSHAPVVQVTVSQQAPTRRTVRMQPAAPVVQRWWVRYDQMGRPYYNRTTKTLSTMESPSLYGGAGSGTCSARRRRIEVHRRLPAPHVSQRSGGGAAGRRRWRRRGGAATMTAATRSWMLPATRSPTTYSAAAPRPSPTARILPATCNSTARIF
jgi:hypothetical protein